MKKLLLFLLAAVLCGAGYAQISTFPYNEGFENNGTELPTGWTQEQVSEAGESGTTQNWQILSAGDGMFLEPAATHSGSYKAAMGTDIMGGSIAKLISPALDLTGVVAPQLKFWHTQGNFIGVNVLKVYYKTSAGGTWELLETYDTEVAGWTQKIIDLPNPSADYYIAFEGEDKGGYGVQLDDILIAATPTGPVISESPASLDFGNVYYNLPFKTHTRTYTIKNTGVAALTVDSIARILTDPRITVTGLPVTIPVSGQEDITVELDIDGLASGFFNWDLVLKSNDDVTPEFTVNVKAASIAADVSSYIYENFGTDFGVFPSNWTYVNTWGYNLFLPATTEGINGSPCVSANFDAAASENLHSETVQTNYVAMGTNPVLSFNYKVLQQTMFDYDAPVAAGNFTYAVSISKDNGETWNNVSLTPNGSHTPTIDFTLVTGDVSAYANEICLVRISLYSIGSAPQTRASLDDVIIGTEPINELAAVSITGSATPTAYISENYTVKVENFGSATQTSYTVRLMKRDNAGDIELDSKAGVSIAKGATEDFVFEWTPNEEGTASIYGEVVFAADEFILNNKTNELSLTVQPGTFKNISVGTGTEKYYYLPYNTYYLQSLTQSIYYPHELKTNGGKINSLTYQAEIVQGVVNLQNVPIQVWMGETDKENLEDGWVDPSTLTLVYDGVMDFPVGEYDVTVNLDSTYEYKGGNLVVYSFKQQIDPDGYGNLNDGFASTNYPASSRSRGTFLDDLITHNPESPESIQSMAFDFIPNTNFVFDFEGMGSLEGLVDNGTTPLNEAKIQIIGTNLYTLTDDDGNYELPYLIPGNYSIEVSKHGYFLDTFDITITADDTEIQNATLVAIPTYTVSGKVTGSNAPNGLEDVEITLLGYDKYTTTTDASGNYSISGVYQNSTYNIEAKLALYVTYNSTVDVLTADTSHNLTLIEMAYPVFSATAQAETGDAVVEWEAPIAARDITYTLDDNSEENGEGVNGGYNIWLGNKYVTNDEGVLKSVNLFGFAQADASAKTVTIEIFNANQELVGSSSPFRIPEDSWINVPLANIPYSGTFYVMVRWRDTEGATNRIGSDENGPNHRESLSMVYDGTNWATFYSQSQGTRCVFLIRPNGQIIDETVTPTPSEYTVYRIEQGKEELPEQWTELTTTDDESYTDTDWSSLDEGTYRYAVTATYTGDSNVSKPVLTNAVTKQSVSISIANDREILNVYPNPVIDILNIQTSAVIKEIVIIDGSGKVLKVQKGDKKEIDLRELSAGYYVARIHTASGITSVKVVKK